jgi:hypothetical protein
LESLSGEAFSIALSLLWYGIGRRKSKEATPSEEGDAPARAKASAAAWIPWIAAAFPIQILPQKAIHTDFYVRPRPILQIYDYKSDRNAS